MSCILFAWELGSNFGHVSRMLPVAEALRARGHRIEFALRELDRGQLALRPHGFTPLQAPIWTGRPPSLLRAPTFAGVLQHCGYHAAPPLAGLVTGWRRLYDLLAPDLVVLDHAPGAALAARIEDLPCARLGSGWFAPPDTTPPAFVEPWQPKSRHAIAMAESRVLGAMNAVLEAAGRPPLQRVTQVFRLKADLLTTFPELDHFGVRTDLRYYGPTERPVSAAAPRWPDRIGPRIFAFIDATYVGFDALMRDLAAVGFPAIVYARVLSTSAARRLSQPALSVVTSPVDMDQAARDAALVICHAGHGTICSALLAGTPLLLLPRHSEQRLLSDRVVALGAALMLTATKAKIPDHAAAIRALLEKPGFTGAAGDFARRHRDHDVGAAATAIAEVCEAVLAGGPDVPRMHEAAG